MKRTKELRSCVSFKSNWPLQCAIIFILHFYEFIFSHNSPSQCWTDMVFCKRIELSVTDRGSYGLIYLPSSDLENRNHCLHVALGEEEGGGGGEHWTEFWKEVCRRGHQTLTLFKTKILHFATMFMTYDLPSWSWFISNIIELDFFEENLVGAELVTVHCQPLKYRSHLWCGMNILWNSMIEWSCLRLKALKPIPCLAALSRPNNGAPPTDFFLK